MRKRAVRIGIAALALTVAGGITPAYQTLVSSARSVQRYIEVFNEGGSGLNPLDRLVFSLVRANSKPHPRNAGTAPERRT